MKYILEITDKGYYEGQMRFHVIRKMELWINRLHHGLYVSLKDLRPIKDCGGTYQIIGQFYKTKDGKVKVRF